MFLDQISQLKLIEHDPERNIIKGFPIAVQKVVITEIVTSVLKMNDMSALSSKMHVRWVMECIGGAFSLPMSEHKVIQWAIEIYFRWVKGQVRPAPIDEDLQHFFQQIFLNFSLLFQVRPVNGAIDVQHHSALCSQVLKILEMVGRDYADQLETDTWKLLLQVMLGISHDLLSPPVGSGEEGTLATELCPQILQVLFELWLRSKTTDLYLWENFQNLVHQWTHRLPVILQWNSLTLGLSQRVIRYLYGKNEGSDGIIIVVPGSKSSPIPIPMERDYLYYTWYRCLHILGPLTSIEVPTHYQQAYKGVLALVEAFLAISSTLPPDSHTQRFLSHPSGNTILHLFGDWLFTAASNPDQKLERGKAVAFIALCKIFTARGNPTPILETYLARFYYCIIEGLSGTSGRVITSILLNSSDIFSSENPGLHCLIPFYISAIAQILPHSSPKISFPQTPSEVREVCISILGSLLCLPNYFDKVEILHHKPPPVDIPTFSDMKNHIVSLLLDGLSNETNASNAQALMWNVCVYAFEEMTNPELAARSLASVASITLKENSIFPTSLVLVGFQVLAQFADLSQILPPQSISSFLTSVCTFVTSKMLKNGGQESPTLDAVISGAFYCLRDWIIVVKQLFSDDFSETLHGIFSTLQIGITGALDKDPNSDSTSDASPNKKVRKQVQNSNPPSPKIRDAANSCLSSVLREVCRFPITTGPARHSTLQNEVDLCLSMGINTTEGKHYFRHFSWDDQSVFTIVERTNPKSRGVTIMIRDFSGRYSWDSKLLHYSDSVRDEITTSKEKSRSVILKHHDHLQQLRNSRIKSHMVERKLPHLEPIVKPGLAVHIAGPSTKAEGSDSDFSDEEDVGAAATAITEDSDFEDSDEDAKAAASAIAIDDDFDTDEDDDATPKTTATVSSPVKASAIVSQPSNFKIDTAETLPKYVSPRIYHNITFNDGFDPFETLVYCGIVSGSLDPRSSEILSIHAKEDPSLLPQELTYSDSQREPDEETRNASLKAAMDSRTDPRDQYDAKYYGLVASGNNGKISDWPTILAASNGQYQKAFKKWLNQTTSNIEYGTKSTWFIDCILKEPEFYDISNTHTAEKLIRSRHPGEILDDYLDVSIHPKHKYLLKIGHSCHKNSQAIVRKLESLTHNIRMYPPKLRNAYFPGMCKFQYSRQFLSHLGFLHITNQKRFHSLRHSHKLMNSLRQLDKINERERHNVACYYIRKHQFSQSNILHNTGGPFSYQMFLSQLGWWVRLSTHKGWNGGLDRSPKCVDGVATPYYSDTFWELAFHVATHFPNFEGDTSGKRKKRHLSRDPVAIVWFEDNEYNYLPDLFSKLHPVQLCIQPLKNGLYKCTIHSSNPKFLPLIGPVRNQMVLSQELLGSLVRQTVLLADRLNKWSQESYKRPELSRQIQLLDDVAKQHKLSLTRPQFYAQFFSGKR